VLEKFTANLQIVGIQSTQTRKQWEKGVAACS